MQVESEYRNTLEVLIRGFFEVFRSKAAGALDFLWSDPALAALFASLQQVQTLAQGLGSLLEDTIDAAEEDGTAYPALGECFASLAEELEFEVYDEYVVCSLVTGPFLGGLRSALVATFGAKLDVLLPLRLSGAPSHVSYRSAEQTMRRRVRCGALHAFRLRASRARFGAVYRSPPILGARVLVAPTLYCIALWSVSSDV
jgi:hypothetical protein